MTIKIEWSKDEEVALIIGTIMCEIPHKTGLTGNGVYPITVETVELNSGKMLTTVSNESH